MKKYELVLLLDPSMKADDRQKRLDEVEAGIKTAIKEVDDIGILDLAYDLWAKKGKDRAYFKSYLLELDNNGLSSLKESLLYKDFILRSFVFVRGATQPFFKFVELNKKLETIIESRGKQKFGQKVSFYTNDENIQYLTWKAIIMLRKYVTRFADIKPRKYTGNAVKRQKKLRKCILRAKELGLLEYVR